MTLEQISYLSQTLAAVAVVASLIYAALQFRLYAKAIREARFIESASVIQDFNRMLASDGEAAGIFRKGLDDFSKLDSVERWRFGAMMQMLIANSQLIWEFEGVPHHRHYTIQAATSVLRRPGARQWWTGGRKMFPPATVAAMDEIVKSLEAAPAEGGALQSS